jgi:5-keto-L-gluconate epimerase
MTIAPNIPRLAFVVSARPTGFASVAAAGHVDEAFAMLSRFGYDGIELAIRRPREIDAEHIRMLVRTHSLDVAAIGTGQAYVDEGLSLTHPDAEIRRQAFERLVEHVDLSRALGGVPVIIGLIRGRSSVEVPLGRCLDLLRGALGDLASRAKAVGAGPLFVEPINRYETDIVPTLDEATRLLDAAGGTHLGVLADLFHMNIEEADPLGALATHASRIAHFHLADSNRWAPGFGHIDVARSMETLYGRGFSGWASVECLPRPPDTMEAAYRIVRPFLDAVGRKP